MTNQSGRPEGTHSHLLRKICIGASDIFISINKFLLLMPGYLSLKYNTRTSNSSTKALNSVRNNYPHSLKETNLSDPRNYFWSTIMQHESQSCFPCIPEHTQDDTVSPTHSCICGAPPVPAAAYRSSSRYFVVFIEFVPVWISPFYFFHICVSPSDWKPCLL